MIEWRRELEQVQTVLAYREFLAALSELSSEDSAGIVRALYAEAQHLAHRQLLVDFMTRDSLHPKTFEVLVELVRDSDGASRFQALRALGDLVFLDFAEEPRQLDAWLEATRQLSAAETWCESARRFVARLRTMSFDDMRHELLVRRRASGSGGRAFRDAGVQAALRDAGLPELVMGWIESGRLDDRESNAAHGWVLLSRPDDAFLKRHYLPIVEDATSESRHRVRIACAAIGQYGRRWALEPLVLAYVATGSRSKKQDLSGALDRVVGGRWLDWVRATRSSLGPAIRRLELPERHPWEQE